MLFLKLRTMIWAFIFAYTTLTYAHLSWYNQKLEGWYYFQEADSSDEPDALYSREEAFEILEEEKRQLQEALSLAVLCPTRENIETYMTETNRQVSRSSLFAESWGNILSENQSLVSTLKDTALLEKMSKTHFLLFCFHGKDPLSKKAAKIALLFAERHGWQLKALSLDGLYPEGLENVEIDEGMAKILNISSSPAFYVVDPVSNEVFFLAAGPITSKDIENSIARQFGDLPHE